MKEIGKSPNQTLLFVVIFSWVFACSLAILNMFGAVPYYVDGTPPTVSEVHLAGEEQIKLPDDVTNTTKQTEVNEKTNESNTQPTNPINPVVVRHNPYLPEQIVIPSLHKTLPISNPQSRDVDVLDKALLKAVVRYPGSGLLGREGNIFIFGHSTGYRTVNNQLFKAFNGIQNLEEGSVIELHGKGKINIYQVTKVTHTDADEALVDLRVQPGERKLTLSTCDSFGKKTSRFVVEAEFLSEFDDTGEPTPSSL